MRLDYAAIAVSLISALAQLGMMMIHCRRDKRRFAELEQRDQGKNDTSACEQIES